ncbi:RHS repeat-associated core domain-containing protein [Saccharospirillum impatiens]|uniref:RHS repeat-associated core domain-containing protein n=1 Tax=Saccharospirillum impatiens TaxID=169438 RepID=UPI00048B0868
MYSHETGEEVWSTDHETYGKTRDAEAAITHPVTGQPFEPSLRFQGQYEDVETGLYQNLHRYYDRKRDGMLVRTRLGSVAG